MNLLSIDLGRTSTKTCAGRDPKQVVLIPANVAHLTVEQVRRGDFESQPSDPLLDIWLEYQGEGCAIGQLAADFGANLGVGQSKVEDALLKTLACIGFLGLSGDTSVVLGLPFYSQEQFDQEKSHITSLLESPHRLIYRGAAIDATIQKVWVMPEGYGSLVWSEVNRKKSSTGDFPTASVAIVDIGHQTTDFLMIDRFRFARGTSQSKSFGMSQFYDQIAAQIQGADSQSLSLIASVHCPEGERFFRPKGAAKPTDLDEILPSLKNSFAKELSDRLLAWLPERATDVIVTGGGGEFFWSELRPILREARLKGHLAKPSRQANVLGQYIYGETQLAKQPVLATTV